ncbi:MAG: hypothetical protein M1814_006701 [Vezdaea aestivalis]|nr:MAG: hypothetical protein M1814_006701 [Vezdaea aestivalis]
MQKAFNVVLLGGGITALQTAKTVQKLHPLARIHLLAEHFPGARSINYTSPWAGAHWRTHAGPEDAIERDWDVTTLRQWTKSIEEDKELAAKRGLFKRLERNYWSTVQAPSSGELWWKDFVSGFQNLKPSELPPGAHTGIVYETIVVNVDVYLDALFREIEQLGAETHTTQLPIKKGLEAVVDTAVQIAGIRDGEKTIIINALGLAAGKLCKDDKVYPVRGQILLVKGEVGEGHGWIWDDRVAFIMPRPEQGVSLLVGPKEQHNWSEEPTVSILDTLKEDCKVLVPQLLNANGEFEILRTQIGRRPARKGGARVEVEPTMAGAAEQINMIHSYGHGGAGLVHEI